MNGASLPQLLVSHWRLAGSLDLQAIVYMGLYVYATRRARHHWPARRTFSFLAGIVCVLVALQSGLDRYDDRLLSVHMAQHMLLLLLVPVLLLGGRPALLALLALRGPRRRALARALSRLRPCAAPVPSLAIFYAVVLLTHLSWFYDATLRHDVLHQAEHALYLLAGLLVWWPILDGDPVPAHRLGGLAKLVYLLAAMLPMDVLGAYLDRHASLVYPGYAGPAHSLGLSAIADQAQAGAIMWVAGTTIMVGVGLWAAVAALVAEERRLQAREAGTRSAVSLETAAHARSRP